MVFEYLITAENLMRQRGMLVFEHWEYFLSPSVGRAEQRVVAAPGVPEPWGTAGMRLRLRWINA